MVYFIVMLTKKII